MFSRTALVSGANGFIGKKLCHTLKSHNVEVHALIRREEIGPWNKFFLADLTVDNIPRKSLENIDIIFHLAGKAHALHEISSNATEYQQVNVEGTRKLIAAANEAGVKRFIFFSSLSAMGDRDRNCLTEQSPAVPQNAYGDSKLQAEQLVLGKGSFSHACVLRPAMAYGPGCKGNLPKMICAVEKRLFPPIPEVGNKRSMVHVNDIVQAAILAATHSGAAGRTYIITDGQEYSTRQIFEWICEALERPVPQWQFPIGVLKILARVGDGISHLLRHRFIFDSATLRKLTGSACYSSDKIKRELGFQAKNNLKDSLPDIIAHMSDS